MDRSARLRWYSSAYAFIDYTIQTSNDGTTWTTVATVTGPAPGATGGRTSASTIAGSSAVPPAATRLSASTNSPVILAIAAAAFVALKFLFHIHFSLFGWGFYVDVIVTAALVYFAMQMRGATAPAGVSRPARPVASPTAGTPPPSAETGPSTVPPEGPGGSTPPPRV